MGPRPLDPKEIDELPVPPGKAYTLDIVIWLLVNRSGVSLSSFVASSQTIYTYKPYCLR